MKIEFAVWQFVRVMVEMESLARPRGRGARDTFRARNTTTWNDLDKELEALAQLDPAKYAKRMMKDTIVVNAKTPRQIVEVSEALGRVINHMGAELRRGTNDDATQRASLMFEQTELKKLRSTLTDGQVKSDGKGKARDKGRPKPQKGAKPRRQPAGKRPAKPTAKPKARPKPKPPATRT